ncbi:hypothetical protein C8F01DRAFT_497406 [Mycena amicta]|nr:hypothetical protein C8F01DRAFT_497406 [Mycena amicta]
MAQGNGKNCHSQSQTMTRARKLLILDLNGTLLLRSKHSRGSKQAHGPRLRTVHPRPYLPAFREYIFHTNTQEWLDTMVWSSAQPASVADMVNNCFRDQKQLFLAIWARDTLDLPPELYCEQHSCASTTCLKAFSSQKTPTTKDLVTPWKAFPSHNAQTTLLLDDSVRKAHRHPFNHVCVPEYSADFRRRDLSVLHASKGPSKLLARVKAGGESATVTAAVPKTFDETLLAVVGILETLKLQDSVASWIEKGGLVVPSDNHEQPTPDALVGQLSSLTLNASPELSTPSTWFEREETVRHWADQGRHALAALQIDVVAGVQDTS